MQLLYLAACRCVWHLLHLLLQGVAAQLSWLQQPGWHI
jgi:hypothetical protein